MKNWRFLVRMAKLLGKFYGSFEPEELSGLDNLDNWVKLIIDTKTGIAYYIPSPHKVNHIDAASEYLRIPVNKMNTANAGHIVGANIETTELVYIVGKSSVETSPQKIKHTLKQIAIAESVVKKIIRKYKIYSARAKLVGV